MYGPVRKQGPYHQSTALPDSPVESANSYRCTVVLPQQSPPPVLGPAQSQQPQTGSRMGELQRMLPTSQGNALQPLSEEGRLACGRPLASSDNGPPYLGEMDWERASVGFTSTTFSSGPPCGNGSALTSFQQQMLPGRRHGEQTWAVDHAQLPGAHMASMPPLLEHAESSSSVPSMTGPTGLAADWPKLRLISGEGWGCSNSQQQQRCLLRHQSPVGSDADHQSSAGCTSRGWPSLEASASPMLQRHVLIRYGCWKHPQVQSTCMLLSISLCLSLSLSFYHDVLYPL